MKFRRGKNYSLFFISILFWSFSCYLFYLFFFSSFGYFAIKNKISYKRNLEIENDILKKENQILEDKLIQNSLNQEEYHIILFKFHDPQKKHTDDVKFSNPGTSLFLQNHFLSKSFYLYFYLFIFIVFIGYISIMIYFIF